MEGFEVFILVGSAFVIAIVTNICGIGGGVFFVPLLMYFEGIPITIAREISQFVLLCGSSVSSISYFRQGRVQIKAGGVAVVFSIAGVLVFKFYFSFLNDATVQGIFGSYLLFTAAYFLVPILRQRLHSKTIPAEKTEMPGREIRAVFMGEPPNLNGKNWVLKSASFFFAGGFLGAMLGTGGGVIFIPTFCTLLDFPVHFATATSIFTLSFDALANVIVALGRGQILFPLAGTLAAGAIPGAYLGARFSERVPKDALKGVLSVMFVIVGTILLLEL